MGTPLSRTLAFALGAYALLSLPAAANRWWIDLRPWPEWLVTLPALALCAYALAPRRARGPAIVALALLACAVGRDIVSFARADVDAAFPIPFSAVVLALFGIIAFAPRVRAPRLVAVTGLALLGAIMPLGQVLCFGTSTYARPADRIVVFGARCHADGAPSLTLVDRVRTACDLYHRGLAPRLRFSGGPGDGAVHETEAMAALARSLGVPGSAIELDRTGLDTAATVAATPRGRTLAVSHFYHLPRVKMAYRAAGRDVLTVPARASRPVRKTSLFVLREVPAFWWYWLRDATWFSRLAPSRSDSPSSST
ncbi:MAG: YdcF family protein [Planctomycetota bacterium]|nr:YdcF family protein [Planctomycetota bacterium]